MRVSVKSNQPGQVGRVVHDADLEPIFIEFNPMDLVMISSMPPEANSTLFFPDEMSHSTARAILGMALPPPIGQIMHKSKIMSIVEAIKAGHLDRAEAMLLEGIPRE